MTPTLDAPKATGKIAGMIRRLIHSAMRSSIEELLSGPITEIRKDTGALNRNMTELKSDVSELKTGLHRIDLRLDDTNSRIMGLGARLDKRIDDLSFQQNRTVEEIAGLKTEVSGLKRDQHLTDVVERRLSRIEDRVFSR